MSWLVAAAIWLLAARGDPEIEPATAGNADDELHEIPAHAPMPFDCAAWSELQVAASVLGHGHFRQAHDATFRGEALVLKVPYAGWTESDERKVQIFRAEVIRLLRMHSHPSVPRMVGYCLEPPRLALLCERLLPWSAVVHDHSLNWMARLNIAISAARMLQYWESYVDHRGVAAPRFFWDLKANNVGTDVARTHIKILDVESFSPYVAVKAYHDMPPRCTEHAHCVPRRLRLYHDPALQTLSELRCNLATNQCDGVLDDRTNVFRICLIVVEPLLNSVHVPQPDAVVAELKALLARCMDVDHDRRSTATALRLALEGLRVHFSQVQHDGHHHHRLPPAAVAAATPATAAAARVQSLFDQF